MSGLPSGQYSDYLIIAVFGGAAAAVLASLLLGGVTSKAGRFIAVIAIAALLAFAVFGRPAAQNWMLRLSGTQVRVNDGIETKKPQVPGSEKEASPTPPSGRPKESPEVSFVKNNVAPPPKSLRKAGQWALVIADPDGRENYPKLATAVSSVIAEGGHSTAAIFRPSVTHKPGFDTLFAADPALSRRMAEYCDQMLVARVTSSVKDNPSYPGLLSLTLTLDAKIISTQTGDVQHQFQVSEVGAGYSPQEARTNAEDNVAASLRSQLKDLLR